MILSNIGEGDFELHIVTAEFFDKIAGLVKEENEAETNDVSADDFMSQAAIAIDDARLENSDEIIKTIYCQNGKAEQLGNTCIMHELGRVLLLAG